MRGLTVVVILAVAIIGGYEWTQLVQDAMRGTPVYTSFLAVVGWVCISFLVAPLVGAQIDQAIKEDE